MIGTPTTVQVSLPPGLKRDLHNSHSIVRSGRNPLSVKGMHSRAMHRSAMPSGHAFLGHFGQDVVLRQRSALNRKPIPPQPRIANAQQITSDACGTSQSERSSRQRTCSSLRRAGEESRRSATCGHAPGTKCTAGSLQRRTTMTPESGRPVLSLFGVHRPASPDRSPRWANVSVNYGGHRPAIVV